MTTTAFANFDGTYVSTTIPYVNGPPHVGFALELVQADTLARGLRLLGEDVHASTGTDDHSLKNVRAAAALNRPVQALLDENATRFAELARALGARFDDCVRTSRDERHAPSVRRLFRACRAAGDLYRQRYRGAYCVGCESFVQPEQLVAGLCPEHGVPPETVEEENWFFRLSRYRDPLREAIESGRLRILPDERKNEVLAFLDRGLLDFSVSRSAARAHGFGITVPDDPDQVVYVWVDALANYLTTFDHGRDGSGWSSARRRVHVLGKGVLRFHAVYWPALLLAAKLPLPDELRVHGYLTVDGRKIGKSNGNGVDPIELVREHGATALRYYLLRHIPPFKDADFSRERLIRLHDAELADELGNLARRVLTLVHRQAAGRVPAPGPLGANELELEATATRIPAAFAAALRRHELGQALDVTWDLVRHANRYLDVTEPWRLARLGPAHAARLSTVLATAAGALRAIAIALSPFVPDLSASLAASVRASTRPETFAKLSILEALPVGLELGEPPILVPRLRPSATPQITT